MSENIKKLQIITKYVFFRIIQKIHYQKLTFTFLFFQTFGHISGCHINPIVTVAAVILGNTPLLLVPVYITGQLVGGLAGFGLVKVSKHNKCM